MSRRPASLCVVDVGNTHTVLGLYEDDRLEHRWRLRTDPERTTDEWGLTLQTFFAIENHELSSVDAAAMSSVVPPAIHALRRACRRYFDVEPLVVGPGIKTGLAIRYDNPREIGADRIVNAVAAHSRVEGPCIVVDFGTATTLDCIDGKGAYLGGAIAPGIRTALDALVSRAAKLPRVEIERPRAAIGKTTEQSMQSGLLYGYTALVDGLAGRLAAEMEGEVAVIATGGLANAIAAESRTIDRVEPDLTLEGLRLIHQRNRT